MLRTICAGAMLAVVWCWNADAQAQDLIFETIETVQILNPRDLPVESEAAPRKSFFGQAISNGGEAKLELSSEDEEAFRDKFTLDAHAPLLLADWRAVDVRTGHSSHLGYVYCAARVTFGSGQKATCFRDKDRDGSFDGQTSLTVYHRDDPRLTFTDITPTRYRAEPSNPQGGSSYSYGVTLGYVVDKSRSVLTFRAQVPSFVGTQLLEPVVEVSTSSLPATVEIGGARVQVLSWDGKRAKVRVDRQMPIMPISFVSPSGGGCGLTGNAKECRISFSEVPLP
jgi:hypothetical protein